MYCIALLTLGMLCCLCVCMVAQLHELSTQQNKHLLSAEFSHREHCSYHVHINKNQHNQKFYNFFLFETTRVSESLEHMCQTSGPKEAHHIFLCGLRSLHFKPQPAYLFGTVVVYTCLPWQTAFCAML